MGVHLPVYFVADVIERDRDPVAYVSPPPSRVLPIGHELASSVELGEWVTYQKHATSRRSC